MDPVVPYMGYMLDELGLALDCLLRAPPESQDFTMIWHNKELENSCKILCGTPIVPLSKQFDLVKFLLNRFDIDAVINLLPPDT